MTRYMDDYWTQLPPGAADAGPAAEPLAPDAGTAPPPRADGRRGRKVHRRSFAQVTEEVLAAEREATQMAVLHYRNAIYRDVTAAQARTRAAWTAIPPQGAAAEAIGTWRRVQLEEAHLHGALEAIDGLLARLSSPAGTTEAQEGDPSCTP